jgi:DNA-binding transcriptional LysR family regulator
MIDTDRLALFVAVARERGFSRAARKVHKTQSAVSQAVRKLEDDLGQTLFVRDSRTTALTHAGGVLLVHADRVLAELARAEESLSSLREIKSGELVIGTSDTLAYYVLPPVFAEYRRRYPGVELRLDNRTSPAVALGVAERTIDVGVVSLPLPEGLRAGNRPLAERVRTEPLAAQDDVVICPPGHPLAARKRVAAAALAPYPLVLLDRTTATRAFLDAELARAGARANIVMEMSSVEVIKKLVELGFGVSVVPRLAIEREVAAGVLVGVAMTASAVRRVGIVTGLDGAPTAAAGAFVQIAGILLRA